MKIRVYQSLSPLIVAATATLVIAYSQQPRKDSGAEDMNNISDMSTKEMNKCGDHVMGFDHMKTTYHFRLQAIYAFLRFQIKEHKTGDSLEVRQ